MTNKMNHEDNSLFCRDILLQICSKMNNSSLRILSQTSLWLIIREFIQDQYFWYLRVQQLVSRELQSRIEDWKTVYHILESSIKKSNPFTIRVLKSELATSILLDVGYVPSLTRSLELYDDYTLLLACEFGCVGAVRLLLADKRIDPTVENNEAIRCSSQCGASEIVRLLLEDGRVDPAAGGGRAMGWACNNGHTEVVRLLLQDKRVDLSAGDNAAIIQASIQGHTEVVKLLLEDKRADPSADNNCAIRYSSEKGYTEVVRLLLQDKRVDPSAENNYAILSAYRYRRSEVVKLLEQDPRVSGRDEDREG